MREKPSKMPPSVATDPPLSPVPAPRATSGRPCRSANLAICTTCSVVRGNTTASGWRSEESASYS